MVVVDMNSMHGRGQHESHARSVLTLIPCMVACGLGLYVFLYADLDSTHCCMRTWTLRIVVCGLGLLYADLDSMHCRMWTWSLHIVVCGLGVYALSYVDLESTYVPRGLGVNPSAKESLHFTHGRVRTM